MRNSTFTNTPVEGTTKLPSIALIYLAQLCGTAWGAETPHLWPGPMPVQIQPGAEYVLAAPAQATVVKAPEYARAVAPNPILRSDPASSPAADATRVANAVAVLKFSFESERDANTRIETANQIDHSLVTRGERGIEPKITNLPWEWETDSGKTDAEKALLQVIENAEDEGDMSIYNNIRNLLAAVRSANDDGLIPDPLLALISSLPDEIRHAPRPALFWKTVFDKVLVYKFRNMGDMGSNRYLISTTGLLPGDIEPNNIELLKYYNSTSKKIIFLISRNADHLPTNQDLTKFWSYWSLVIKNKIYSDDDLRFLQMLSDTYYNSALSTDAVAERLLNELDNAENALHSNYLPTVDWNYAIGAHPASKALISAGLHKQDANISEEEIDDIDTAVSAAFSARLRFDIPQPKEGDVVKPGVELLRNWLIEERRSAHVFLDGTAFEVKERRGEFENGDFACELLNSGLDNGIILPIRPDTQSVQQDFDDNRDVSSASDPFLSMIRQSVATMVAVTGDDTAERDVADMRFACNQVSLARADLQARIREVSPKLREYARQILTQASSDLDVIKQQAIFVPEPAIVEASFVKSGEQVVAGQSVALLRPIFHYFIDVSISDAGPILQYLHVNMPIQWNLACSGPVPTTLVQRQLTLLSPQRQELVNVLKIMRTLYFRDRKFSGRIDSITRGSGIGRHLIRIGFDVSNTDKEVRVDKNDFKGIDVAGLVRGATQAGITMKEEDGAVLLHLDAGPLEIGEKCIANFAWSTPEIGERVKTDEAWTKLFNIQPFDRR